MSLHCKPFRNYGSIVYVGSGIWIMGSRSRFLGFEYAFWDHTPEWHPTNQPTAASHARGCDGNARASAVQRSHPNRVHHLEVSKIEGRNIDLKQWGSYVRAPTEWNAPFLETATSAQHLRINKEPSQDYHLPTAVYVCNLAPAPERSALARTGYQSLKPLTLRDLEPQ